MEAQAPQNQASEKEKQIARKDRILNSQTKVVFTPEYEYKTFFFVVPFSFSSPDVKYEAKVRKEDTWDVSTAGNLSRLEQQAQTAKALLSTSPEVKIVFFVKGEQEIEPCLEFLREQTLSQYIDEGRVRFQVGGYGRDIWAQDLGETTGGVGGRYVVGWTPPSEHWRRGEQSPTPYREGSGEAETVEIPAVMQGGNITKAVTKDGRKVVIVGGDDFNATRERWKKEYGYDISDAEIKEIYKKAFGADDVIILGGEGGRQSNALFHIDLAVFFPRQGVAVVVAPQGGEYATYKEMSRNGQCQDPDEIKKELEAYKRQLRQAGFEVIEIPVTWGSVYGNQSYANTIVVNSGDQTYVIMPTYGDKKTEELIAKMLEEHGMKVIFVENTTTGLRGSIHCFTGALAFFGAEAGQPLV